MTKSEALYFLEGLTAGIAAPSHAVAKRLLHRLAHQHKITAAEFEVVRAEIDLYLDEAEAAEAEEKKIA